MKDTLIAAYLLIVMPAVSLYGWDLAGEFVTDNSDSLNLAGCALYVALIVHALYSVRRCLPGTIRFFRKIIPMRLLIALFALTAAVSCAKVEPGYAGIKVNQYGSQKGVEDFPIQTGRVGYNPFTEDVYVFPTFRQNVVWDKADEDESITFNSIEGSVINADVGISYSLEAEKVPHVFVEFRQDMEHITHVFVRSEVRDALARHAGTFKVIDIFGARKQALLDEVKADVQAKLGPIGFNFEMVSFVGALRCDQNVMQSINATIEATQLAISAQNKVVQSKAEADQAIETARGQAESILAVAKAQAEANILVAKSLTPELVQWKALERWNGVQPMVLGGSNGFVPMIQLREQ